MRYHSLLSNEDAAWGEKEVIKFRWVLILAILILIGYIFISGYIERAFFSLLLSLIYIMYNSIINIVIKKANNFKWIGYISSTIDVTILSLHIFNYSYFFKPIAVATAPSLFLYPVLIMLSVLRYDGKLVIYTTAYIILCFNLIFFIRYHSINPEIINEIASGGPEGAFYRSVYFALMGYFMFSIPKMINRLVERQNKINNERHEIEIRLALETQRKDLAMQNLQFEQEITEQLNYQKQIITKQNKVQEELLKNKDKFFSIIGHDLRSPLSVQSSLSEYLLHDFEQIDDKMLYNTISAIHKTANNGLEMLSNLIDWSLSQSNALQPSPVDINIKDSIQHMIDQQSEAASSKQITIYNNTDISCCIFSDEQMFETIIRNILSNAIKFTPKNGIITFTSKKTNTHCRIEIEDNGIGMNDTQLEHLFSLHETKSSPGTNNEKGTGLGLVLCKEMIDINNGSITVESIKNKGTKFILLFPHLETEEY